mgnify:FL=1|tara:strand:- start:187 stop:423 length:237 start_codon:yes stop_codon:yes gene_type:complete
MTPEQMDYVRYLLRQMFTESAQTWADVVRYGTSQPLDDQDGYPDDYGYEGWDESWDSDVEDDKPEEPDAWGGPLFVDN